MLRERLVAGTIICLLAALAPNTPATAQPSTAADPALDKVTVYTGSVPLNRFTELRKLGLDGEDLRVLKGGQEAVTVEAIISGRQAKTLRSKGIDLKIKTIRGVPTAERLRQKALAGQTVYRSYSEPGGLRDELIQTAGDHPSLTKLVNLGSSTQGKPILGVKVTTLARSLPDGQKPSTIYAGAQHSREWITPEMVRRLMHHVIDGYGKDPEITQLLQSNELWFVPVANPDGYDFTFTPDNRLWRKNLRDNNGDGQITPGDGVDPNRNFAYRWGYDDEGSSPDMASETYRGPGPNSEPETRALDALFKRVRFDFFVNYHSAAELLLYGLGWQVSTPTPDDVIYEALAGDDANPAVPGYDPDLSAELYITNGDTDSHMTENYRTLGFTPEMTTCETASNWDPNDPWLAEDCESGFNFPDDERLIQREFLKNIPFALSVAKSAKDPANPVSSVGRTTPDFVVDKFDVSYGASSQEVATIARRSLLVQRLNYSVNGGPTKTAGVSEWKGGKRYGNSNNDFYAEMRGKVTGTKPGDSVKAWFTGVKPGSGPVSSESFTYRVHGDVGGQVLVLAAEDVTGISPVQGVPSAKYADEITSSLSAAGYSSDVYDFDAMGRKAPHHLGVLSHYKAVVWETGDDIIHRAVGQVPGTAAKSALDIELSVRDYLNEGGKLLVGGQFALFAQSQNGYTYNPFAPPECTTPGDYPCLPLQDDFLQYWLGAYTYVDDGGTDPEGDPFPLTGNAGRFNGFNGTLNGAGSAQNQGHTASFLSTSSFLPPSRFPQFGGSSAVDWVRPGGAPFDPHTGDWYLYSGRSDVSYKRLTRTIDLSGASSGKLNFFTSYDTEADWDYLFVEAHEVGTDNWTTLPDANGHTQTGTGDSCPEGWRELHPHLDHYQGADCSPTGTTGSWNAATAASGGWQEWSIDLSGYAGKRVEVSISYVSDWATQGLGVFLDDTRITVNGAVVAETSFEDGLGGWTLAGPPPGSQPGINFARSQIAFDEGAVMVTADTVFTGFGLEGLDPSTRNDFVARALRHLLG